MPLLSELYDSGPLKDFGARVQHVLHLQEQAKENIDPSLRKAQEGNFRRLLDKLYWEILEKLCHDKFCTDEKKGDAEQIDKEQDDKKQGENAKKQSLSTTFSLAEKMLINYGLISYEQIEPTATSDENSQEGNSESLTINHDEIDQALKKYNRPTPFEELPIYRLSEWVSLWQVNSQFLEESNARQSEEEIIDDEKALKFNETRLQIYQKLQPILAKLPGSSAPFLRSILSGDFDQRIDMILALQIKYPEKIDMGHRRLISMKKNLMEQLKAAIGKSDLLKMVLLLEKISHAFVKRNLNKTKALNLQQEHLSQTTAMAKLISKEIALLKGFLPIGGMEGREFFTSPILRNTSNILSKTMIAETLNIIHEADPHIPRNLPVIIVPYKGGGFFEWDKNSIILPVCPSIPKEEVVIRAMGNYKIMSDQSKGKGQLKKLYEKAFDKGQFKNRFLQDYVQWITHMTKGHRKIMSVKKFDFFQEHVGPSPKDLLCSDEIRLMPKSELRKLIRDLHARPQLSQDDYLDLCAAYWLIGDHKKANQYAETALTAGMPNPKVFLACGYTLSHLKDKAKAKQMFKSCQRYFKNSLWGAYASRALD